jgi:DNA helicase II / ATP-dependent DNA helicase PcrA
MSTTSIVQDNVVTAAELDEFQTRFVASPDENIRLLASAGSGKTQSLLWRCAELSRRNDGHSKSVATFVVPDEQAQRPSAGHPLSGGLCCSEGWLLGQDLRA